MSLAILFHFLCAQHISDINIFIIRSLRLFCWITTLVVLFLVRCVLEFLCGWTETCNTDTTPNQPHRNSNTHRTKNNTTNVVIQQKLLMMDILMSETCWAHKKWNKIASDIKLVFFSSPITMMHGPINIRILWYYGSYCSLGIIVPLNITGVKKKNIRILCKYAKLLQGSGKGALLFSWGLHKGNIKALSKWGLGQYVFWAGTCCWYIIRYVLLRVSVVICFATKF